MIPRHLIIGISLMLAVALAMGIYGWRMRGREAAWLPPGSDTRPVTPPVSGPIEQVTLYVADDNSGKLLLRSDHIPLPAGRQQRAEELLQALLTIYLSPSSPHPLAPGSELRGLYLADSGLAVIDLNAALADGHRSGILVEELTLASLAETLAANVPGITRVKILVDGQERETLAGHADLTGSYDVTSINQMASQLQQ